MRIQLQSLRIGAQFRDIDTGELGTLIDLCAPCRARVQWQTARTKTVTYTDRRGKITVKTYPVTVDQSLPVTFEVEVGA